ncbi:hypothetical protein NL676_029568 [Syzygium grande]|nr:hypothetical protein NL676_029568 [Syzygium grande]
MGCSLGVGCDPLPSPTHFPLCFPVRSRRAPHPNNPPRLPIIALPPFLFPWTIAHLIIVPPAEPSRAEPSRAGLRGQRRLGSGVSHGAQEACGDQSAPDCRSCQRPCRCCVFCLLLWSCVRFVPSSERVSILFRKIASVRVSKATEAFLGRDATGSLPRSRLRSLLSRARGDASRGLSRHAGGFTVAGGWDPNEHLVVYVD